MPITPPLTLPQFISSRLGEDESLHLLGTMFARSFGAGAPREFWRYWNPVYGYYLQYYCYRPLSRRLARPLALLVTFAASGFLLHDLPFGWWVRALKMRSLPLPFVTLWFVLIGAGVLLAEGFKLSYCGRPCALRVTLNALHILIPLALAFWLSSVLR